MFSMTFFQKKTRLWIKEGSRLWFKDLIFSFPNSCIIWYIWLCVSFFETQSDFKFSFELFFLKPKVLFFCLWPTSLFFFFCVVWFQGQKKLYFCQISTISRVSRATRSYLFYFSMTGFNETWAKISSIHVFGGYEN